MSHMCLKYFKMIWLKKRISDLALHISSDTQKQEQKQQQQQ